MFRSACVLLVTVVLVAASLRAQSTVNGEIRGRVTDAQGAVLQGVAVTVSGDQALRTDHATTDGEGAYHFVNVPPGEYALTFTLSGFASVRRPAVWIRAGSSIRVNLQMAVGGIDETSVVTTEAPLLEARSGGQAVNVSGELLRTMPLLERREWFGAMALAPGVTSSESVNNERLFYVHGSDAASHVIQIDGADMTPAVGGSLRFVGLNTDAIEDIQIKTAGLDASAPLGLGGIINMATANGTNALKGTAALLIQPRTWNGSNSPGGTSGATRQRQVDLSVGAPLVDSRLWTFTAYRFVDASSGISRSVAQLAALQSLVPGFAPFDSTTGGHLWFTKLTAQLSSSHQASGFFQRDVSPSATADGSSARARPRDIGGSGASIRLNSVWSDRLISRLGVSYNDKGGKGQNVGEPEPVQRVYQSTRLSGGRILGTSRLVDRGGVQTVWNEQHNAKATLSLDSTLFLSGPVGSHEIQTGLYAQPHIGLETQEFYPNQGFVYEEAVLQQDGIGGTTVAPFHRLIYDGNSLARLRRRGRDFAVYIQDAWRPWPRLTLNIGVRVDRITWTDQLFHVTSQSSVEVGPRFGLNYALTSDSRDIVKAHWVRVHDQPAATGASVGTVTVGQRDLYDLNLDGNFETTFVTPATAAVTPGRTIDPAFHQPFVEEWGFGYAKQLPGGTALGIDLVRRNYRDRPTLLESNGLYDGSRFTGYLDEAFNEIYQATNNRWNWPVYTSLELSLTKRTTRLQGIVSYVRQWRHLAGTWQPHDPAALIQPGAFANDKAIGSTTGSTATPGEADSLSGISMTQFETASSQWQDHTIRLGAAWTGPWQLLVASNYTFQSGAWSGPLVTLLSAPDPAFGPTVITLTNGRAVANPLATAIRFAYATRGDGQLTTPPLHVWNVRLGRRFSVGRIGLDASVDVFNLINNGSDASFAFGANQTFGANFGTTTYRQLPRSGQFVLRVSF